MCEYVTASLESYITGAGRLAYAGAAKVLPICIKARQSESSLEHALRISAARNELKVQARLGAGGNYRLHTDAAIISKYNGDSAAIINAATRTSPILNATGIGLSVGGLNNLYGNK